MVKVAAIQMMMSEDRARNVAEAVAKAREAVANGARIILLPELFESLYFCKDKDPKYFSWAKPRDAHPLIETFRTLAAELSVVVLVSYFEAAGEAYYNTLAAIDADGTVLGHYRKTHIPDGPGYEEKYYFTPGDTGFMVWKTAYATIGAGICWDQWFPETARSLALLGAELLFYPTAIGSEPEIAIDSKDHWQRVQQGHAAANVIPVIAANRIGEEVGESCALTFYGHSFMTDHTGAIMHEAPRDEAAILYSTYDLEAIANLRTYWALFQDRRPERYGEICG